MSHDIKKVVLAYSGGLDTSIILKWLQQVYQCEVVTFTADLGQGEEVEPARQKAEKMGIREIYMSKSHRRPVQMQSRMVQPVRATIRCGLNWARMVCNRISG